MIHFERVAEPPGFQEARRRGLAWLESHPSRSGRPLDCWSPFLPDLAAGFRHLCAYSAIHLPEVQGTVDHYLSWSNTRETALHLAYDRSNYRYASHRMNDFKGVADARVLDPFEVHDDWFELLLPSCQLRVTSAIPAESSERARFTLEQLHLVDDERVVRQRAQYYDMYRKGELSLDGLRRFAPLIARAVERSHESPRERK